MITLDQPDNFADALGVVGCFVESGGQILMLLRASTKPEGSTWGSPGGKIDAEESPEEAVVREVFEETGIHIDRAGLGSPALFYVEYPNGKKFLYYKFKILLEDQPQVTLNPGEHTDFYWGSPEEVLRLPLILHEGDTLRHLYEIE